MSKQKDDDAGTKKKGFKRAADLAQPSGKYTPAYEAVTEAPRRIVAASAALQKRGKTTWGFTMPKPIQYMQLDANYEHALSKARKEYGKDKIKHLSYAVNPHGDLKANANENWERFVKDFEYGIRNFPSVLVDTASELMDVRKLAEWGRTTQIPQIYYGPIYADFRWFVKSALDSNCNVLFIHRLKDEWMNGDRTGGYVMEGWRGIQFDAQVYLEHARDSEGTFTTNIIECAQDSLLMGMTLEDDDNNFAGLATKVYPDSDEEDWE